MKHLLALSLLCAATGAQQEHPLADVGKASYLFTVAENEVGSEDVEFRADGWTATGRYDLGAGEVTYLARWTRAGADAGEWYVEGDAGPVPGSITCGWEGESIAIAMEADGEALPGSSASWEHDGAPVFFENLVWTVYSEVAVRLFEGEGDPVGSTVHAFQPQNASTFPIGLKAVAARVWQGAPGEVPLELRDLELDLAGTGMFVTCTSDGLLVHLSVPSQKLDVVLEGYEGAARIVDPITIVDAGPWRKMLSEPTHDVVSETGVRIAMRDGVELAADVHRPEGEGKRPAILVRTPYDRKNEGAAKGAWFARRGYAVVVQDVRGRFESAGEWFPLVNEARDGSDTIDWIAKQEWCDGSVGMIGGSYVGWVQWFAASTGNPHLKAIVPQVAPPDPLENIPYEGGAFLMGAGWWATVLEHMESGAPGLLPDLDFEAAFATLPLGDLDEALGVEHRFLDEWLAHPPSDTEYWEKVSYQHRFAEMDVAALHVTGWYDGDQPGSLQNFPALRERAKTERARAGQFLIVGPWGHNFNAARRLGDVDFGPEAVVDIDAVYVRFFDRYLKGIENGIEDEDPVLVFVMGENTWRRAASWPPPDAEPTPLFLASDGEAHERDGDGRLVLGPPGGVGADVDAYVYDPQDLPETPEIDWTDVVGHAATMDLSTLPDREDVLDYTSPPLAAPVTIVGPVEVIVWIETDAADTDVVAQLLRVEEDGALRAVAGGVQRVRYRNGPGTDDPVEPGTPVRVTVDCWATGQRLEKGQRLRLEVSSNGYPGYARNLNTLESPATAREGKVATNRILHDAEHASHVLLPVVGEGPRFADR